MTKIPVEQRRPFTVDNTYWRSLEQLDESPQFKEFVEREFQDGASEMKDPVSRRSFLKLMTASAGLAGYAACRRPVEHILPYAKRPEDLVPGTPQNYATVLTNGGEAIGAIVETHEGRPTKVEGNPSHPESLGATDVFMQAQVLSLYDPDRSATPRRQGKAQSWDEFEKFAKEQTAALAAKQGEGLAILSEAIASPTLARQRRDLLKALPKATWHVWEPINQDNILAGSKLAFGAAGANLVPRIDYEKADIVVALDSDFLVTEPGHVKAARQFAKRREPEGEEGHGHEGMNRLYAIEAQFTATGAMADHRLRVKNSQVHTFARALIGALVKAGLTLPASVPAEFASNAADAQGATWDSKKPFLTVLAKDLFEKRAKSAIVVGSGQPAEVHAIAAVLNTVLGSSAVTYAAVPEERAIANGESLKALADAIDKKAVDTLVILGGNPVYNAPVDFKLADKLKTVAHSIHLSGHVDETSSVALWHLPRAHPFEAWSDAQAADGTRSVQQPLIMPMHGGRNDHEVLALVAGQALTRSYDIVRATYGVGMGQMTEKHWRQALHAGMLSAPALTEAKADAPKEDAPKKDADSKFDAGVASASKARPSKGDLEIAFITDATQHDGRYANNPWLQELPDPMTKLTWDNAAMLSPATAKKLGVKTEDMVKITYRGKTLEAGVWEQPGQSDDTVALALGYGRKAELSVGKGVGFDAYALRHSDAAAFDGGAKVEPASGKYSFANTQEIHHFMTVPSLLGMVPESRPMVREATLSHFKKEPGFAPEMVEHPKLESLFTEHKYDKYEDKPAVTRHSWGMTIDLNTCTGCNVCTIACQAENNIAVVGKDQVRRGREMHWIRLDRYFANLDIGAAGEVDTANPRVVHQPVACQHCENAPCEQVCPVTATAHGPEGTNDMQYSRCVGTRYCSNNCPYKVRRFNFLNFHQDEPEVRAMAYNPDVTVRMRGVMEKCTYCVQRINLAKIEVKLQKREMKDGDVTPACAQACPADAIVFGDLNDKKSRVAKAKKNERSYDLLAELNVKPHTSYLARIRNPHQELA